MGDYFYSLANIKTIVLHITGPTIAIFVRWIALPLMASVANGVRAAINDLVQRALSSAKIPSRLEPSGLYHSDRKCPDGIPMVPWWKGKLLVWDAMCPDTYAPSYSALATSEAGAVAAQAQVGKCVKYSHLDTSHEFVLVTIETLGPLTRSFLKELGHCLRWVMGD